MARKHEKFEYNYGWRTAPEQWSFFLNGKYLPLNSDTRNTLACMCLNGNVKGAEDKLKRYLRKIEKKDTYWYSICFFKEGSKDEFYYTKELLYRQGKLQDALHCYKTWKHYIQKKNCMLDVGYEVTEGEFKPFEDSKVEKRAVVKKVDLNHPGRVRLKEGWSPWTEV